MSEEKSTSDEVQNTESKIQESTTVEEVDINIDEIFGQPGAESVMLPEEDLEEKNTVFSKEKEVDTTFIDKPVETTSEEVEVTPTETAEETISELDEMISEQEENEETVSGRPRVDKSGLVELANKMIEEGSLLPFDDDKDLEDYTAKDFRELFETNFQQREEKIRQDTPREFFQSLPEELQVAAKYVADGGQDLKSLFRTLAQVEDTMDLNPEDENHQAEIARQYLHATRFGTAEEIEAEIQDWADLDRLGKKAKQFKPKLDKMQETIVAQQLAEQEQKKAQQAEQAKAYQDNVYNTLAQGQLDDLKLDKKTQSLLFSGLVQPNYPSISGKPTNLLGHLLEKYQFVEPRHDLIAEALWLLADPKGYKTKVRSVGADEAVRKTARQLKTAEQSRKLSSSATVKKDVSTSSRRTTRKKQTVPRKKQNMFSRGF
tara:strand:- start:625 stop:1920 length:1296 start_codon:yes stop_codon:yes gene_type:complete